MKPINEKVIISICCGGSWELQNGEYQYLPFGLKKRGMPLSLDITFGRLQKLVSKKLNLNGEFVLSYKQQRSGDIFEIHDEDDVFVFLTYVVKMGEDTVTLYVSHVATQVNEGGSFLPMDENLPEHIAEGYDVPEHVSEKQPEEMLANKVTYDDVSPYLEDGSITTPVDDDFVDKDHTLTGETAMIFGLPENEPNVNPEDGEEFNVVGLGLDGKDIFWGMPPTLESPFPCSPPKTSISYNTTSHVLVNQSFDTKEELQLALGLKCLEEGFQIKPTKSAKDRYEAKCISEGCEWRIRATTIGRGRMFLVRKLVDRHTCTRTQVHPNHRQANKKVLGHILKDAMLDNSRIYRGKEIMHDMNARYKISISYTQAWRAKCEALKLIRGTPEESFSILPVYCHNLKKKNPGTVTHIETDANGRFELLFVAFGCAVRSFVQQLRPVLIIDGAHLKGRYLGTMFIAVGMDGNNQIMPIAYGVGKTESGRNWTWFLLRLKECIGENPNLAVISDRASAIALGNKAVFPNAAHGICCRHLSMNLRLRSTKSIDNEVLFWKACKAYTVAEFDRYMHTLCKTLPPEAQRILVDVGKEKWARCYFPGMRYNVMTSNSAESMNAVSRFARALPITMLIEFFRANLQQWFYERRNYGGKIEHALTPWAEKKINKRISKSHKWMVYPMSQFMYEVRDGDRNGVVDLQAWTCSCMKWQISGLPCGHVIATTKFLNQSDCSQWAHPFYRTNVYQATYMEVVHPVGPQSEWEIPDDVMLVLPPVMDKRQAGRPRNNSRIPSQGEEPIVVTCSRCKQKGHTRVACRAPLPSEMRKSGSSSFQTASYYPGSQSTPYPTFDLND